MVVRTWLTQAEHESKVRSELDALKQNALEFDERDNIAKQQVEVLRMGPEELTATMERLREFLAQVNENSV